jgi:drug/metabolite transporter (DMT)-like permease
MPFCVITMFFIDIPPIGPGFVPTLAWVLPLIMVAIVLHFRAIHVSPLSLTLPFLSFTPVFVLFTGDLILNEQINSNVISGILLVVAVGYIINLDATRNGFLGPLKAIWHEPGSVMMLIVAALYGLTSVGGKVIIQESSPLFAGTVLLCAYGVLLTLILVGIGKASLRTILRNPLLGFGAGGILFLELICHNLAISMVTAAYMITIKRMAGIFSVLYGWLLFREQGIRYRLLGTAIMTAGAIVIGLFG